MKAAVYLMLAVIAAECVFLIQTAQPRVDHNVFTAALQAQQQNSARQRLAWIQNQMLNSLEDRDVESWLNLGAFYDLYGYQSQASAVYRICQQLDPDNYRASYELASVAVKLGHHDSAMEHFKQALAHAPSAAARSVTNYRLGLLSLRLEQEERAAAYFEEAYASDQNWPARYERLRLAVVRSEEDYFRAHMPALLAAHGMAADVYHLHVRGQALFEDYSDVRMQENPMRVSQLYREFDVEKETRQRAVIGLDINRLFVSDRESRHLQATVEQLRQDPQKMKEAAALYQEAQCVICHGQDGRGLAGPNLRDDFWLHGSAPFAILSSIAEGRQHMPAHKFKLSPEELHLMTAYIIDLNLNTEKNDDGTVAGKAAEGHFQPIPHH